MIIEQIVSSDSIVQDMEKKSDRRSTSDEIKRKGRRPAMTTD